MGVVEMEIEVESQETMDDVREKMITCVVNVRAKTAVKMHVCMYVQQSLLQSSIMSTL